MRQGKRERDRGRQREREKEDAGSVLSLLCVKSLCQLTLVLTHRAKNGSMQPSLAVRGEAPDGR